MSKTDFSNSTLLKPGFEHAEHLRIMIPVGATLDVPNGILVKGRRGDTLLIGGLATTSGVAGKPNLFKSTLARFMEWTALSRIGKQSNGSSYDTESNQYEPALSQQAVRIVEFLGEDIYKTKRWVLTNKEKHLGNAWYEIHRSWLLNKVRNRDKIMVETPFWNRDGDKPYYIPIPTFGDVDSFTEFTVQAIEELQQKVELGDNEAAMLFMKKGLAQTRMLMEVPPLYAAGQHYCIMTVQVGKENAIAQAGPPGQQPETKLTDLKGGDKIKGATDKFLSLTLSLIQCVKARRMLNDASKEPEFPRNSEDDTRLDTDLTELFIKNLRSKSGQSGMLQSLVVSQSEGVQPALTEYWYIRQFKEGASKKRYGIDGSNISYWLDVYPEVKLSRTTIRGKINSDYKLRRAMNMTSEMCQMSELWHSHRLIYRWYPADVYRILKERGYDWELLLMTREWWTVNDDQHPIPRLGNVDVLNMCWEPGHELHYHPFWYPCKLEEMKTPEGIAKVNAFKDKIRPHITTRDVVGANQSEESVEISLDSLLED